MDTTARLLLAAALALACAAAAVAQPARLQDTGYGHPGLVELAPRHPLWSDGADKRRWLRLPPGTAIDARDADAWRFPPGTRLWKDFAHGGRRIETRFIERRPDGSWRYATYVWRADGREATLAPAAGLRDWPVPEAPGGRVDIPSREDCLACHAGAAVPVLGLGAFQLAGRLAPLLERGWLRGLPAAAQVVPPDDEGLEAAALGHLHGNCAHCHHDAGGGAPVRLDLRQTVRDRAASRARVLATLLEAPSRWRPPGAAAAQVVVPGDPGASVLHRRLASQDPYVRMPPLGVRHVDADGLALVDRWIQHRAPRPRTDLP